MKDFDPATSFGYDVSKRYDAESQRGDEEDTVAFLARLAGGRDALEFAIGTGRIALELARAGIRVDGIELSQDMVDRMREKLGGDAIDVTIGDMSRVNTGRAYGLVYLVFNTIGNLLTQDDRSDASRTLRVTCPTTACSWSNAGSRPPPVGPDTSASVSSRSRSITSGSTSAGMTR